MSLHQLRSLVAQAERSPSLQRQLRWPGSWQGWLQRVQELGFRITADDLQQLHAAERQAALLHQSQIPAIRPLR